MKFMSKSLFLAGFLAVASLPLSSPIASVAQSNTSLLPPGDYIYNPKTGSYVPFGGDPNRKRTGFVEDGYSGRSAGQADSSFGNFGQDCENAPGLSKNARQIGQVGQFIKTAIIGEDDRCPLRYGPDAPKADRAMNGAGRLQIYKERICSSNEGDSCSSFSASGHLVGSRSDIVVTNVNNFKKVDSRDLMDPRSVALFRIRVWNPRTQTHVAATYRVKAYRFGTMDPDKHPDLDYAFLLLESEVGQVVDGLRVPEQYRTKPLPFKKFRRNGLPNIPIIAGYNREAKDFSKNCAPFSLVQMPSDSSYLANKDANSENLYWHNADTIGGFSGGAVAVHDNEGKLYFEALHKGWFREDDEFEQGQLPNGNESSDAIRAAGGGINVAIKAASFYDNFERFEKETEGIR
ncbi:MAG: hypothetical protein IPJ71_15610 [Bdellovibrionales bacterium]|nr:hypothetical protein [Bdellovibrionales bacterium]